MRRQTELEHEVRRRLLRAPGTGRLQAVAAPTLRALRDRLDDRVLVEYVHVDGALRAVVVSARRARLIGLGAFAEVEQELRLLRFALHRIAAPAPDARMAGVHRANARMPPRGWRRWCSRRLAADIGDRELVLVPTGELHALPWATLSACAGRPLSVAPSAALWLRAARERQDGAGPGRAALLVAGPGLVHADSEVDALAALYPGAATLTGADAGVDAVAAALRGCDRAHLACHGSFRADNPLFSALRLADGPLTVHDVESLGAGPREIVLSACDSGLAVVGRATS